MHAVCCFHALPTFALLLPVCAQPPRQTKAMDYRDGQQQNRSAVDSRPLLPWIHSPSGVGYEWNA